MNVVPFPATVLSPTLARVLTALGHELADSPGPAMLAIADLSHGVPPPLFPGALREYRRAHPGQPLLIVLPPDSETPVTDLLAAGADEILVGEASEARLATAIAVAVHHAGNRPAVSAWDQRLQQIIDSAPDSVAILDASGRMRFANQAHKRQLGYEPHELTGADSFDYMHPDDIDMARTALARVLTDPLNQDEVILRMRHADGHWVPLEIAARELRNDAGETEGFVIVGRDLTQRMAMENAVRESEARLRTIFEASPDPIAIIGSDDLIQAANPAFERILGYDAEALIGTSALELRHPSEAGLITAASNQAAPALFPARLRHRDGHWVTLEISAAAMYDGDGNRTGMVAIGRDVSDRDDAIAALLASEARFRQLVDTSPDLIAVVGMDNRVIFANAAHEQILGIDPAAFVGADAATMISEDDTERLALATDTAPGQFTRVDVRHSDGSAVPAEICVSPLFDAAGQPEGYVTITRDLRQRLAAGEEVRRLEERFARAFQFAPYGSLMTDPEGRIINANQRVGEILGRDAKDLIGKTTRDLGIWADRAVREEIVAEALHGGHPVRREVQVIRSDGVVRDITLSMVAVDVGGQAMLLTGAEDITEQKRAREAVARLTTILSVEQETSVDAILVAGDDGHAITWNQQFLRMWGLTDADMRASRDRRAAAVSGLLADSHELGRLVRDIYARPDAIVDREFAFRDGRIIEGHSAPLIGSDGTRYGRVWTYRDITERRMAEDALRASEERYRQLVEMSPSAIAVHQEGRIVYVNAAGLALFDTTFEELASPKMVSLVHPDDRERVRHSIAGGGVNAAPRFVEARLVRFDGTTLDVEVASVPTSHEGRPAVQTVVHDVTERNRAREALLQSERRFALAFAEGGVASIMMRLDGTYIDVNERFLELVGARREEIIGSSALAIASFETAAERDNHLQRVLSEGQVRDVEGRLRHSSGELLDVLTSSVLIDLDGERCILSSLVDITLRKRAEAILRESEERYRQIVELSPDPIVIARDIQILYANQAMCRLVGAESVSRLIGLSRDLFADESDMERTRDRRKRWREGRDLNTFEPLLLRTLHGGIREVEVAGAPISYGGAPAFQVVIRDMTDINRREEERLTLERKMLEAQKLESLGVLAGGIAHDFNNLLVAIMGNAGLADLEVASNSPVRQYLSEIQTASQRAADLARQMLAYSGRGRFVVQSMDLTKVVEEMAHLLGVSLPKKARLVLNLARNLPPIEADATQIRQIVMNLVINSGEAVGDDEGVITISTGVIDATPEYLASGIHAPELPGGRYVYLEVADSGCGMDEATLKRIFDPFFTTKFTGRGLGLAAVLGIVRGHSGSMLVASQPGSGSTFRLLLPAQVSAVPEAAAPPSSQPWKAAGTILLADDEDTVRLVTARMLQRLGFDVVQARDGADAVQQFTAMSHADLVLLDLMMPRLDGQEAFAAIRQTDPKVPVVILSGYSEQEAAGRFAGHEVAGFLQKPFTFAELQNVVRAALG